MADLLITSLLTGVLVRLTSSENRASLCTFQRARTDLVSVACQLILTRLQYSCSMVAGRTDYGR